MGEKTKTIFKVMDDLNYHIITQGKIETKTFSEETKQSFRYLEQYIKSGNLGTSNKMRFILEHYNMPYNVIAQVWNMNHDKESEQLTVNAVRIQESRINKTFTSIFGVPENVESAFMSEDMVAISEICDKVRILNNGDTSIDTFFTKDLVRTLLKDNTFNSSDEYALSDCKSELSFLIKVSNRNILNTAKQMNVDKKKLAFVVNILTQSMIRKGTYSVNQNKFDLITLLMKGFQQTEDLNSVVETQEFLQTQNLETSTDTKIDYEKMYLDLLQKYNDLQATMKVQQESDFENTSSLVSNLFSEDIAIPNAVMDILNDIAKEYDGDKVLHLDEAKELGDTMFALSKYAMQIVGMDLSCMNEKMLYCIWAALNNQLEVENANDKEVKKMIKTFKTLIEQRVDNLIDMNYVEQVQQILNNSTEKAQAKEVSENE